MDPYDPTNLDELDRIILDYLQEGRYYEDQPWGISTPAAVQEGIQEHAIDSVPGQETIAKRMKQLALVGFLHHCEETGIYKFVSDPRESSERDQRQRSNSRSLLCPREQEAFDRLEPWVEAPGAKQREAVAEHLTNGDFERTEAGRLAKQLFLKGCYYEYDGGIHLTARE